MIVYNLGYLPGGDKSITTEVKSTLASVKRALTWIRDGGVISISCYIGHKQGSIETIALKRVSQYIRPQAVCCLLS